MQTKKSRVSPAYLTQPPNMRVLPLGLGAGASTGGSLLGCNCWSCCRAAAVISCRSFPALALIASMFARVSSALLRLASASPPFCLICRRAISPRAAATKKPAVDSPSCFSDSIPSITSCGMRTVVICDLLFVRFAIAVHPF